MSRKIEDDPRKATNDEFEKVDQSKRDLMKGAAVAATAAAAVGGASVLSGEARADTFKETAERYVPPGQWWHHLETEWWEFPSDDPQKMEVWGYTDKLSYAPGEQVSFHVNSSAPTFDVKIYRDGLKLEEVHSAQKVAGKKSPTPKDCYTVGCGWPALYKWKLPNDLRSGFHLVVFSIEKDGQKVEQETSFF